MSCLCLLHIFTQTIVMEMITHLSLHIKREASLQLSVWDAKWGDVYGQRHRVESKWGGADNTASLWSRHLAASAFIALICDPNAVEMAVCGALANMLIWGINPFKCGTDLNTSLRCGAGGCKQYRPIIWICQRVIKTANWGHHFAVLIALIWLIIMQERESNPAHQNVLYITC